MNKEMKASSTHTMKGIGAGGLKCWLKAHNNCNITQISSSGQSYKKNLITNKIRLTMGNRRTEAARITCSRGPQMILEVGMAL
jgi:hypothetical protein